MWPAYSGCSDAAPDTTYMAQPAAALCWLKRRDDGGSFVFVYPVDTCSPSWNLFPTYNMTEGCCRATWNLWRWHPLFTFLCQLFLFFFLAAFSTNNKVESSVITCSSTCDTLHVRKAVECVNCNPCPNKVVAVPKLRFCASLIFLSCNAIFLLHTVTVTPFCSFHSRMHWNCNFSKWATLYNTLRKWPCEREGHADGGCAFICSTPLGCSFLRRFCRAGLLVSASCAREG